MLEPYNTQLPQNSDRISHHTEADFSPFNVSLDYVRQYFNFHFFLFSYSNRTALTGEGTMKHFQTALHTIMTQLKRMPSSLQEPSIVNVTVPAQNMSDDRLDFYRIVERGTK